MNARSSVVSMMAAATLMLAVGVAQGQTEIFSSSRVSLLNTFNPGFIGEMEITR